MVRGLLATFLAYASNSAGVGNGVDLSLCVVSPVDRRGQRQERQKVRNDNKSASVVI